MTESSRLERRYRVLARASIRRRSAASTRQEILSVLMASALGGPAAPPTGGVRRSDQERDPHEAAPDQRAGRVGVQARASHAAGGASSSVRGSCSSPSCCYDSGQGGWWGALLVPAATLQLFIAYRLIRPPDRSGADRRRALLNSARSPSYTPRRGPGRIAGRDGADDVY
jgi:hypothetical protein